MNAVCSIPIFLTVKKLAAEMTANKIVTLSSIVEFDKDKLNILSKGKWKYKAYLILDKKLYEYIINAKGPFIYNYG